MSSISFSDYYLLMLQFGSYFSQKEGGLSSVFPFIMSTTGRNRNIETSTAQNASESQQGTQYIRVHRGLYGTIWEWPISCPGDLVSQHISQIYLRCELRRYLFIFLPSFQQQSCSFISSTQSFNSSTEQFIESTEEKFLYLFLFMCFFLFIM